MKDIFCQYVFAARKKKDKGERTLKMKNHLLMKSETHTRLHFLFPSLS